MTPVAMVWTCEACGHTLAPCDRLVTLGGRGYCAVMSTSRP